MPKLPDGSFARGEKWFALRSRPKNQTEEFWARYSGYGNVAFREDETAITPLHKSAAFGWPQQSQFLLARNPELWADQTSYGQTALDVARQAVAWCKLNDRSNAELKEHEEVASWCLAAQQGKQITFDIVGTND